MQDSNITYTVKAVGIEEATAKMNALGATIKKMTVNQNGTVTATGKLTSTLEGQASATDRVADATDRASRSQSGYFAHIAKTTVQSALINKLFLELVDVSGQAIKQVDLMNNFPATMASMGQSTEAAGEAFKKMSDYVGQVGGNLGDAASMVTRFTGVTKDVRASVAIFAGLNNALIAGDSNMQEQAQAAVQFAQAFERGKPDMKEWLSLTQNMSFQLGLVAKEMGYVNATALGESLRDGTESMAAFTTKLTELSTGMGPIAQQALARMNGMQFAFNVMKNTLVQGLAAIIDAFGRTNIVSFFSFLTQVIQVVTRNVVFLINAFIGLINTIRGLFGLSPLAGMQKDAAGVASGIGDASGAADDLGKGLKGAKKDAKELNKSLAGFDKMNVLPDKTSGSGGGAGDEGAGGGDAFNGAQIGELGDMFGDISGKLKEAGFWAKVLAGVLGALSLNSLIKKLTGVNLLTKGLSLLWSGFANAGKAAAGAIGKGWKAAMDPITRAAWRGRILIAWDTMIDFMGKTVGRIPGLFGSALARVIPVAGQVFSKLGPLLVKAIPIIGWVITIVSALWLIYENWDAIVVKVKEIWAPIGAYIAGVWQSVIDLVVPIWTAFWTWLTGIWNGIVEVLSGPFSIAWQIISSIFILIVAIVAIALETVYNLVKWLVEGIFNVLMTIGGWIWDNVIVPVGKFFADLWAGVVKAVQVMWNGMIAVFATIGGWIWDNVIAPVADFFVALWNGIVESVKAWWAGLMVIFTPIFNWVNMNIIQPIAKFFKQLWDNVSGFVSGFVTSLKNFLSPITTWIKTNVIDKIANFFQGMWNGIKSGVDALVAGIRSVFGTIAGFIKAPINGIIDLINGVIGSMNKIKVPDWVPGLGGKSPNFPKVPRLARGGVVDRATMAMIGEDGTEAVVPLENNLEWLDKLAAKINSNGNGGQPIQLTVQIGEERIITKVIDLINEKTQMSGRNTILV